MRNFVDIPYDKVVPTMANIIVKIQDPPEKSAGGIIIADETRDRQAHQELVGEIVAMGALAFTFMGPNGMERQAAAVGDLVLFQPYAGTMIEQSVGHAKRKQDTYRIIPTGAVVGIIPQGMNAFEPKARDPESGFGLAPVTREHDERGWSPN